MREIPPNKKTPEGVTKDWAGVDSNHRTLSGTDLQSVAFSHSATYPYLVLNLPLTRLELVTSPLPRECSTSEPQGLNQYLAKTMSLNTFSLVVSHQALFSTREKKPVIGIEPTTYGLQNRCSTVELYRQQN